MNEVKEDLRQLTLKRLRQAGVESAARQLLEMRKDPVAWKAFTDEIDAVSSGPNDKGQFMDDLGRYYEKLRQDPERLERETREDMEWQIGSFTLNDDEWI